MRKVFLSLVTIFSGVAYAGHDQGGGADPIVQSFVENALVGAEYVKNYPSEFPEVDYQKLSAALSTTQVFSQKRVYIKDQNGNKVEVDASNESTLGLIAVSKKRWPGIPSQDKVIRALHEYLGILKLESNTFPISGRLRDLMKSPYPGIALGDYFSLNHDTTCGLHVEVDKQKGELVLTKTSLSSIACKNQGQTNTYKCSSWEQCGPVTLIDREAFVINYSNSQEKYRIFRRPTINLKEQIYAMDPNSADCGLDVTVDEATSTVTTRYISIGKTYCDEASTGRSQRYFCYEPGKCLAEPVTEENGSLRRESLAILSDNSFQWELALSTEAADLYNTATHVWTKFDGTIQSPTVFFQNAEVINKEKHYTNDYKTTAAEREKLACDKAKSQAESDVLLSCRLHGLKNCAVSLSQKFSSSDVGYAEKNEYGHIVGIIRTYCLWMAKAEGRQ